MKDKDFIRSIEELANSLREQIEAEVDGFDIDEVAKTERIKKVFNKETGYRFFLETYFPHVIRDDSRAELHLWLFDEIPKIVLSEESTNLGVAAPRGEAKTTYITHIFNLWTVVTGYKHFNVIISDTFEQASMFLELTKADLLFNPRLRSDFPEVTGKGSTWRIGQIITRNNVKIQSLGMGENIRGLRHGSYRPELVFIDDLENDDNVRKKEQRDKGEAYIDSAVKGLAEVGAKFDMIFAGTILHYDSVLMRKLRNAFWVSKIFKSIIQFPDNLKLWEEWEAMQPHGIIDNDLKRENAEKARQFYLDNKKEMDKGAILSWSRRSLYSMMQYRAESPEQFNREQLNEATNKDATFNESIQYWSELPPKERLVYFGAVDPAMGIRSTNCPSVILIGAKDRKEGKVYIISADIQRRVPDKLLNDIIEHQRIYKTIGFGFESVLFQEYLRTQLVKISAKKGVPVPAIPVTQKDDKILRIQSIQPHMMNGLILIHQSQKTLINQLLHFPDGDIDGPDTIEMLWRIATKFSQEWEYEPVDNNYKIDPDDDNAWFGR
ncbi:phage terminase large subunit [Ignatzschineria cameli]|uniref:Terminase large subunit gp17-like C-terminal domain-containing protein n=2 Tax=Bacteria TaxID=2 RepID=A0A2U2AQN9_9GAMM|nr:phage terminase large subunit [Ignatzschineria cameli]PWD83885.1 hypothetical protein DC080_07490 [Ignatzschineria cameli]PWD86206.1 hypothetical protein DC077_05555 [Ignatzschineria cameli]PWD88653.1 hypothetical protein DC079_08920 [Ignatzschineria cameli]PWD89543.1 hypothetical protein DC081_08820 [Ignatzschineria cameli]PWD90168.1 hypothetical protein DC078_08755 [Ignatzschineria cameli]